MVGRAIQAVSMVASRSGADWLTLASCQLDLARHCGLGGKATPCPSSAIIFKPSAMSVS